ncbi:MAG: PD40 domain-containing protein [Acidobacteria bacterium]|nr:PD40 domain-containing protein [Acidobacteriota bacterium]
MSNITKGFQFGEFYLDTVERLLLRGGKPLPITPKAYQLLEILVENSGTTVEKSRIMEVVWGDSFVEDGNVAFTIRLIRVALDDDAREPRFIETLPRRGYRFIADVKRLEPDPAGPHFENAPTPITRQANEPAYGQNQKASFLSSSTRTFLGFVFLASLVGFWFGSGSFTAGETFQLNTRLEWTTLSTNGTTRHALLSPDGENMIYVNAYGGKESIWMRQLETDNNVEIVPPSVQKYAGLAISPDGNQIYFTRFPLADGQQTDIYRVSVFGGIPTKIIEQAQGWISLSPLGDKISFVRCSYFEDDYCAVWIAGVDGNDQRRVVTKPRPLRISDNAISPDGQSIAFAVGRSTNSSNEFSLREIDINSGAEREITHEKFFNIRKLTWLPDRSGLLISASQIPNIHYRIWQVSYATGSVRPMTNETENVSSVSIDRAATAVVASRIRRDFQIRFFQDGDVAGARVLADANSMSIAADGRVFFSSRSSGNDEIWVMNLDGTSLRQLTNEKSDDLFPLVSGDGRKVFFSSNRSGAAHIWSMNTDGSGLTRITKNEGGYPIFATPDGRWVYFHSGRNRSLWRAAIDGGTEEAVIEERRSLFEFSRDGKFVAFPELSATARSLNVVSIDNMALVGAFELPSGSSRLVDVEWHADGKHFSYILADPATGRSTIWRQSVAGGAAVLTHDLGTDEIGEAFSFGFAPDGKSFGVIQGSWKHDAVLARGLLAVK